jgi:hypothetical protein
VCCVASNPLLTTTSMTSSRWMKSSEGLGNGSKTDSQNTQNLLFAFDHVVPSLSTQQEVFEVVRPVVQEALLGYNSTIFTYGQTGSG